MNRPSVDRLLSLDVFRGITIAAMILVNSPGNETAYPPLEHAPWHGLTPTDWIFPFFVFILGVSTVYALRRRMEAGEGPKQLLGPILRRTAIIFGLGLILNGFPQYDLAGLRIPGVLQRLALCYLACALFVLYTHTAIMVTALITFVTGYHWFMTHFPVPGFAVGDLSQEGNAAAYWDRLILTTQHLYRKGAYDPEGILSTVPATATGLLGCLTGQWLRSGWTKPQKITGMLQAGAIFLLVGVKWSAWFPINKSLWSPSYVWVTAGLALMLLSLIYWMIEIKGWRWGWKPFEILGVNALAAYFLHIFFLKLQNLWKIDLGDGNITNSRLYFTRHVFETWLSPPAASLAYALCYTLLCWALFWALYRKKIFIKV